MCIRDRTKLPQWHSEASGNINTWQPGRGWYNVTACATRSCASAEAFNLPSVHTAGGIARFLATRFVRFAAPVISSSRNKRKGATTSFAVARYATSSWLGEIASVPQRSRDASYQTNLASVRDHATHAPVSTPYHTTRSHGRKRYTCEPVSYTHLTLPTICSV